MNTPLVVCKQKNSRKFFIPVVFMFIFAIINWPKYLHFILYAYCNRNRQTIQNFLNWHALYFFKCTNRDFRLSKVKALESYGIKLLFLWPKISWTLKQCYVLLHKIMWKRVDQMFSSKWISRKCSLIKHKKTDNYQILLVPSTTFDFHPAER